MGTRGLYVFRYNNIYYVFYNHWDSYPSGLGNVIVKEIKSFDADKLEQIKTMLLQIKQKDVTGKNFEGLYKAVSNVQEYNLLDITLKRPRLINHDVDFIYTIDLDNEIFRVDYDTSEGTDNNKFRLLNIPDDWQEYLI